MSEYRVSPEAEAELDAIWLYIARESGSSERATRAVDEIVERFWLLAKFPLLGHTYRESNVRLLTAGSYVIFHRVSPDDVVLILHVFHGSRELSGLLGAD